MTNFVSRRVLALGLASVLALSAASPSFAAPMSAGAGLQSAVPSHITDVRWRRGGGFAAGIIAGGLVAGAIASSRPYYYDPYYYGPGPYYGPAPVYVEPAPAPVYAAPEPSPAYGPRQCFVTKNADYGTGYWRPC